MLRAPHTIKQRNYPKVPENQEFAGSEQKNELDQRYFASSWIDQNKNMKSQDHLVLKTQKPIYAKNVFCLHAVSWGPHINQAIFTLVCYLHFG